MKAFFKTVCFSLAFIFILSAISATVLAAVDVDGVVSTSEWDDAQSFILYQSKSQSINNVDYAELKAIQTDAYTIYLSLSASDSTDEYLDDCGIKLSIPGVGNYTFGVDNTTDFSNNNTLDIDFSSTANLEGNFFFEFRLSFKNAIPDNFNFDVQLLDGSGVFSRESKISGIKAPVSEVTTKNETVKTTSSDKRDTTKSTTKFSGDETAANNSTTESESTSEFIAKLDSGKSSNTKVVKTVLSVLAVILILGAFGVIIFAKHSEQKQEKKSDKELDSDKE